MNTFKSRVKNLALTFLVMPFVTLAQPGRDSQPDLGSLIDTIIFYLNQILVLMMGIAIIIFVFYVIKYFVMADANRAEGGQYVLYSVIGFFVILSFWGLVNILQNTFGLENEDHQPDSWYSFTNLFPDDVGQSGSGRGR